MTNETLEPLQARIEALETELGKLKSSNATGETIVLPIAGIVAFIIYVIAIANFPFDGDPGFGKRLGIGALSGFGGCMIAFGALSLVQFSLRAIVEFLAVVAYLASALFVALLWLSRLELAELVRELDVVPYEHAELVVFAVGAVALFLVNAMVFLILYPMAKTSGSSALDV